MESEINMKESMLAKQRDRETKEEHRIFFLHRFIILFHLSYPFFKEEK
jgi:hypothetical protein